MTMENLFEGAALFLLLTLVAVMWRAQRGPSPADRLLAILALGSTLTAVMMLLAYAHGDDAALDVALIFALLAAMTSVAFATFPTRRPGSEE